MSGKRRKKSNFTFKKGGEKNEKGFYALRLLEFRID